MRVLFRGQIKNLSSLLARTTLGMLLLCGSAFATGWHVDVVTTPLIGNPNGPFSIDFQFNNGSILGNNSVTISNFSYSGGGPVGSPTLLGGVTGTIGSTVVFNNSTPFQELFQTFTPGTNLRFDIELTTNVDGAIPDIFVFAILDKDLLNIPATGLGNSLLLVNLSSPFPTVQTFQGTGAYANVTLTAPEPEAYMSLLAGLPLLILWVLRKRTV
jgi:hypothetical protein